MPFNLLLPFQHTGDDFEFLSCISYLPRVQCDILKKKKYQPFIFPHLLYLFIFSTKSSTSSLSLQKLLHLPLRIRKFPSLKLFHLLQWAPKTKITGEVFNLTCWAGATRLTKSPPLLYKPQNHLSKNAHIELLIFSNFSYFQNFL